MSPSLQWAGADKVAIDITQRDGGNHYDLDGLGHVRQGASDYIEKSGKEIEGLPDKEAESESTRVHIQNKWDENGSVRRDLIVAVLQEKRIDKCE